MRYTISLIFLFILTSTYGQLSVSLGSARKSERFISGDHFRVKPDEFDRVFVNTYVSGSARYRRKKIVFDLEVSYLDRQELSFSATRNGSEIVVPGGLYPSYTTYTTTWSRALLDYSFLGFKLGASLLVESNSFIFKKMPRNETTFGLI